MIWLKVAASSVSGREEAAAVQIAYLIPEFLNGVKDAKIRGHQERTARWPSATRYDASS
jgi:hypothetical protein